MSRLKIIRNVIVIPERCKGCGYCIEFCPRKVLVFSENFNERGNHYPIPKYINNCIGCKFCQNICPDFAIYLEETEKVEVS